MMVGRKTTRSNELTQACDNMRLHNMSRAAGDPFTTMWAAMQSQAGDEYIRELASFIRANERGLAESGPGRRRTQRQRSTLISWFSPSSTDAVLLKTDPHHLFYLLIRLEALH